LSFFSWEHFIAMAVKSENEVTRKVRDLYLKGLSAFERQNDEYAVEMLQAALKLEPTFHTARKLLRNADIRIYQSLGKMKQTLVKAKCGAPTSRAQSFLKKGAYVEALDAAEEALRHCPYYAPALLALAEAALGMDYAEAAVSALEMAHESDPKDIDILTRLCEAYLGVHNAQSAMECLQKINNLKPNDVKVQQMVKNMTATVTMQQGRWEQEGSFREKTKDLEESKVLEQQSRIHHDTDNLEVLLEDARKKLEEAPDNLDNLRKLVQYAIQKKEFDYALEIIQQISQYLGANEMLDRLASDVRAKKAHAEMEELREQLKLNPDDEELQARVRAAEASSMESLVAELEKKVKAYPNDLDLRFDLGVALFRAEKNDQAIREFQLAQQSPRHRLDCQRYMGQLFARKGMFDLAASQLERAAEELTQMDGNRKEVLYTLGEVYEQMGDLDKSIVPFKEIFEADIMYRDVAKKVEKYYQRSKDS
jgi:tetratricopeptide (TPR) repeat protein